ncbi:Glycosyltransferase involved in cell wall bisynthesis [Selenomonas sp. GACV-9]|uniref:glycosyltransferase family 4 protein n=1 Tax=Selenomonas sp. GACV-9 TaxID=3158782 RepID=UPI0008E0F617|nr:Glycosyltransferase involved in cell wall bisynthesis [Selenomonas ruminantium]
MRLIQIAHALTLHDAASEFVQNLDGMFRRLGYDTEIFANRLDARIKNDHIRTMEHFDGTTEDIVIYHMTTGTSFNKWVANYPQRVVLYYHNITPAKFFFGNAWGSWLKCIQGRRQLKSIAKNTFYAWAASEYSCEELRALGLLEAKPLSIIVEPEKILKRPLVHDIYEKYHDGKLNLLIVGRGVPHKKQDEAIDIVRYYKEHIDAEVRLIVVGNMKPSFEKKLHRMVERYGMQEDVVFAGSVSDDELCTWYQVSDALLCLSEHEGFCVPLVEAMAFDKPVFAYAAAAVPETVGRAGIILQDKTPARAAQVIHDTLASQEALARLAAGRKNRLEDLSYETIFQQVKQDIAHIVELWEKRV